MAFRFDNILDTIGNTPVVRINKLAPGHVRVFVKAESFNPMGSVKDRLALGLIAVPVVESAFMPFGPSV